MGLCRWEFTVSKPKRPQVTPVEHMTQSILVFRGHKVLLDEDLAALYGVATKAAVQAVKRNRKRFPEDFLMQLTAAEWTALRSQNQAVSCRGVHRPGSSGAGLRRLCRATGLSAAGDRI
jgi:hypothetical protein